MQDRVPLYPGRVELAPVAGQENTYDMVRADAPTQEGTPLSKATFLKDATASLFGFGNDAVPDDVFHKVAGQLQTMETDIKHAAVFDVNDPTKTGWIYLTAGTVASNKVTFNATTITVDHAIMQCMVLMRVNSLTNPGTGDLVLSVGGGSTNTGFYKLRGNNAIRDKAFPILLDATIRCPSYGTIVSLFKSLFESGVGGDGFSARITQTYNKDQNNFSVEYGGMNTLWWVNAKDNTGGVLGDKDYSIEIYVR